MNYSRVLIQPADNIIANLERDDRLGVCNYDIPTFLRYTKIVDPWNEESFCRRNE